MWVLSWSMHYPKYFIFEMGYFSNMYVQHTVLRVGLCKKENCKIVIQNLFDAIPRRENIFLRCQKWQFHKLCDIEGESWITGLGIKKLHGSMSIKKNFNGLNQWNNLCIGGYWLWQNKEQIVSIGPNFCAHIWIRHFGMLPLLNHIVL